MREDFLSKRFMKYARAYNFNYVNAVLYTVYGPGDRSKKVIDYIIDSLTSTNPIEMTEGGQCLDFVMWLM